MSQIDDNLTRQQCSNFIIVLENKDSHITKDQKNKLIRKFRPSSNKIRIRRDHDQTKIFLKTCAPMKLHNVQTNAKKILQDKNLFILKLTKNDVETLSPYDTQDSSSQSEEHRKNYYVKSNIELMRQKNKSDSLKAEIKNKMQNGMKLNQIFVQYPELSDQDMIGEFWNKLKEYESMLLEKEQALHQENQINQIIDIQSKKNEKIIKTQQIIEKNNEMHLKSQVLAKHQQNQQNYIQNEQLIEIESDQDQNIINNEEIKSIIEKKNEIHQKSQEVSVQVNIENDLNEEEQTKYQKIGLIDKTIKKTPIKNNVESVNQLPGVQKFMQKQKQANKINKLKRQQKWEEKQAAEFLRLEQLKEKNKE